MDREQGGDNSPSLKPDLPLPSAPCPPHMVPKLLKEESLLSFSIVAIALPPKDITQTLL